MGHEPQHQPDTALYAGENKLLYRLCIVFIAFSCILLGFYLAAGSLHADLASVVFSVVTTAVMALIGCILLNLKPFFRSPEYILAASVLLLLGLLLRLSVFDHQSGDYISFLSVWTAQMRGMSIREALVTPIGDYNMPYLYLLLAISRLPFYDLYCIKLISVAADALAALAVGKLTVLMTKRKPVVLLAFAAALLAPTTWLNSGYWGQCDSVYGAFALWGLYCGLTDRPKSSLLLFSLALSFKLQTIFILPVLLFLLLSNRIRLRQLPVFPIGFLAAMLPALLAGRSLYDTFSIYLSQTQAYPYLSLNAPSFWSMISNDYFSDLAGAPVLIAMICTLLVVWVFLRRCRAPEPQVFVLLALIFSLMIPWLLPRMHERYFYLAEMLSIVWAAGKAQNLPVAVVMLSGGFLIYSVYLFGVMPILSMPLVAAIYGLILLQLICQCYKKLYHNINPVNQISTD